MGLSPDSFPSAGVCGIGRVVILKMDRYRKELENWGFLCYDSVINKFFGAGRNSPPAVKPASRKAGSGEIPGPTVQSGWKKMIVQLIFCMNECSIRALRW